MEDHPPPILERLIRKLETRAVLHEADREAIRVLPHRVQTFEAGKYVIREGSSGSHSALLISGFAMRHKVTPDGDRQIVSVHVPGDFIDLEAALLSVADHNVQSLTRCEFALFPIAAVKALMKSHPQIAEALWVDTLVDASVYREWIVNVGRRDARSRIAHILCEFARRLEIAGLASKSGYELPMTQEQMADATGLTSVHVNRTLKGLERDGLVARTKRHVGIPDWERLRAVGGFSELYLHLDQVTA